MKPDGTSVFARNKLTYPYSPGSRTLDSLLVFVQLYRSFEVSLGRFRYVYHTLLYAIRTIQIITLFYGPDLVSIAFSNPILLALLVVPSVIGLTTLLVLLPLEIFVLGHMGFMRSLRRYTLCFLTEVSTRVLLIPALQLLFGISMCPGSYCSDSNRPIAALASLAGVLALVPASFVSLSTFVAPMLPGSFFGVLFPSARMHVLQITGPALLAIISAAIRHASAPYTVVALHLTAAAFALGSAAAHAVVPHNMHPITWTLDIWRFAACGVVFLTFTRSPAVLLLSIPSLAVCGTLVVAAIAWYNYLLNPVLARISPPTRTPGSILKPTMGVSIKTPALALFSSTVHYIFLTRKATSETRVETIHRLSLFLGHTSAIHSNDLTGRLVSILYHATVAADSTAALAEAQRSMELAVRGVIRVDPAELIMFGAIRATLSAVLGEAAEADTEVLIRATERQATVDIDSARRLVHLFWLTLAGPSVDINDIVSIIDKITFLSMRVESAVTDLLKRNPDQITLLALYSQLIRHVFMQPAIADSIDGRIRELRSMTAQSPSASSTAITSVAINDPHDHEQVKASKRWARTIHRLSKTPHTHHGAGTAIVRARNVMLAAFVPMISSFLVLAAVLSLLSFREERLYQLGYVTMSAVTKAAGVYKMVRMLQLAADNSNAAFSKDFPDTAAIRESLDSFIAQFSADVDTFTALASSPLLLMSPAYGAVFSSTTVEAVPNTTDDGLIMETPARMVDVAAGFIDAATRISIGNATEADYLYIFANLKYSGVTSRVDLMAAEMDEAVDDMWTQVGSVLVQLVVGICCTAFIYVIFVVIPAFKAVRRSRQEAANMYLHLPSTLARKMAIATQVTVPAPTPVTRTRAIRFADAQSRDSDDFETRHSSIFPVLATERTVSSELDMADIQTQISSIERRIRVLHTHIHVFTILVVSTVVAALAVFIAGLVAMDVISTSRSQAASHVADINVIDNEVGEIVTACYTMTKSTVKFMYYPSVAASREHTDALDTLEASSFEHVFARQVDPMTTALTAAKRQIRYENIVWYLMTTTGDIDASLVCDKTHFKYNYSAEADWEEQDALYAADRPDGWYADTASDSALSHTQAWAISTSVLGSSQYISAKKDVLSNLRQAGRDATDAIRDDMMEWDRRARYASYALVSSFIFILIAMSAVYVMMVGSMILSIRVHRRKRQLFDYQTVDAMFLEDELLAPATDNSNLANTDFDATYRTALSLTATNSADVSMTDLRQKVAAVVTTVWPVVRSNGALLARYVSVTILFIVTAAVLTIALTITLMDGTSDTLPALVDARVGLMQFKTMVMLDGYKIFDQIYRFIQTGDLDIGQHLEQTFSKIVNESIPALPSTVQSELIDFGSTDIASAITSSSSAWSALMDMIAIAVRMAMGSHGVDPAAMPVFAGVVWNYTAEPDYVHTATTFDRPAAYSDTASDLARPSETQLSMAWGTLFDSLGQSRYNAAWDSFMSAYTIATDRLETTAQSQFDSARSHQLLAASVALLAPALWLAIAVLFPSVATPPSVRKARIIRQKVARTTLTYSITRFVLTVGGQLFVWVVILLVIASFGITTRDAFQKMTQTVQILQDHRYAVASAYDTIHYPTSAAAPQSMHRMSHRMMRSIPILECDSPRMYYFLQYLSRTLLGRPSNTAVMLQDAARLKTAFGLLDPDLSSQCGVLNGTGNSGLELLKDIDLAFDDVIGKKAADVYYALRIRIIVLRVALLVISAGLVLNAASLVRRLNRSIFLRLVREERSLRSLLYQIPEEYARRNQVIARFLLDNTYDFTSKL
ncbi:hypothetical protein J8273_6084 [Carpediemonas membranifera]|uniref:TmcB/TmcC TPR repeats domain-containing protein n=1 Tax=Carpediemonas membranifera TaxID=201153 RepID=A0A8J6BWN6_9EUKA|nr:hypothetical protein J8273_6084 [Carpediemonas membranifera]|eukprot:KAG9392616.1 hypothetical protein J8273_6084 [Carpediemonas membranifera]